MTKDAPIIKVHLVARAVVVTLECTEIMSVEDLTPLDAELVGLMNDKQHPHLVIDLHKVRYLCSSALGYFVKLRNLIKRRGGHLRLCCVRQKVQDAKNDTYVHELFKIVKLDKFFELADDVESALATLP